jgi:hypothetical protein
MSCQSLRFGTLALPLCLIAQISAGLWLVDGARATALAGESAEPAIVRDPAALPEPVAAMRAAILEAAVSGELEALGHAIDLNEVPPMIGPAAGERKPLDWLRKVSADGEASAVLAELSLILEAPAAHVGKGTGGEMYVWPHLCELALTDLGAADRVILYRIAPGEAARRMRESGRYRGWRLGIGPEGVWHWLEKRE